MKMEHLCPLTTTTATTTTKTTATIAKNIKNSSCKDINTKTTTKDESTGLRTVTIQGILTGTLLSLEGFSATIKTHKYQHQQLL